MITLIPFLALGIIAGWHWRLCAHVLLLSLARVLSKLPQNTTLWCYTILGKDGSPYLTRILLPRWRGKRRMIHYIRRADADRDMHNHPWREARGRVLLGGHLEERLLGWSLGYGCNYDPTPCVTPSGEAYDGVQRNIVPAQYKERAITRTKWFLPGDRTQLDATAFHRVARIKPRTWTTLVVGERTGDEWGFLDADDGTFTPWRAYFAKKGLSAEKGKSGS